MVKKPFLPHQPQIHWVVNSHGVHLPHGLTSLVTIPGEVAMKGHTDLTL